MERLKSACLLALIAFAAPAAIGQQATPIQQQTGTVAVIGDVEHCDNYALPAGSALTVQEAVRKAGPLSDTVQVKVIRAGQDRAQWTQLVSATSSDNGEPVNNGDVLVVQSLAPLTVRVQQNAVLRTDTSLLVVGLTQEGIVIGDVLQQTNNLPLAKGQLKVISRFQGQKPIARAELHLPMAHGDVVSISRDSQTVLKGFGGMSPTFSEWKGTAAPPAHDPFIPNITTPDGDGSRDPQSKPQPFQFPAFPSETTAQPMQDEGTSDSDQETEEDSTANPNVSALAISQSEDIVDGLPPEDRNSFASEAATVAPVPPAETPLNGTTNASTGMNPWNLVFLGGLLLAGTLILAGTIKPEAGDAGIAGATTVPHRTVFETPAHPAGAAQQGLSAASVPTTHSTIFAMEQHAETVPALIRDVEWFSADWHGRPVSINASSNELPPSTDEAAPSISATDEVAEIELREVVIADVVAEAAAPQPSVTTEQLTVSAEQVPAAEAGLQTVPENDFSDLEDLLQNRLPIDLCEIQLPLRVALFGRPAGPRRLRIDAAHSAIPSPHMNLSADKRRETPVAVAASQASQAPNVADAAGSLDRALHFLQERTTS